MAGTKLLILICLENELERREAHGSLEKVDVRLRQAEIPMYWPRLASFCTASSAPPRGRGRRWFGTTGEAAPGLRATAQGLRDGGEQTSCSREPEEVEKIGAFSISSRRTEKVAPLWRAMKSLSREVRRQTTQGRPGHPRAPPRTFQNSPFLSLWGACRNILEVTSPPFWVRQQKKAVSLPGLELQSLPVLGSSQGRQEAFRSRGLLLQGAEAVGCKRKG